MPFFKTGLSLQREHHFSSTKIISGAAQRPQNQKCCIYSCFTNMFAKTYQKPLVLATFVKHCVFTKSAKVSFTALSLIKFSFYLNSLGFVNKSVQKGHWLFSGGGCGRARRLPLCAFCLSPLF